MTVKENCDQWMDFVYKQWVENWLKNSKSCLRDSTKNMVVRMKNASSDSTRAEEAWNLLERLKRLSDGFNSDGMTNELKYRDEKPEIYMECALVAYKLGDLQESLNLLRISIGSISSKYSPHKFIDYWLCGCIQWQLPSHLEDAVLSWERSMQIVNDIEKDTQNNNSLTAEKCRETSSVMKNAINQATSSNVPPPPPVVRSSARSASSSANLKAYEAKLKFIPFYGSIPAGNPAYTLDYPVGDAGVDTLELNSDHFYKVYNIKSGKEIRLNPNSSYFILKANGNSMNIAAPVAIDDGDYVLLIKTMTAQNNDIVAGVIIQEDAIASLKRYSVESGQRFLVSESNTSDMRIPMSGEDYIQGVVVAILKPAND